jgi:hypothetical protein
MVNLKAIYGEKLFSRKGYKREKFIPIIANVIVVLITAYLIVEVFRIRQDYALIKLLGLIYLMSLIINPIITWPFDRLNNRLFFGKAVYSEIEHYFCTLNTRLYNENDACYEDYLLEAAFNESLDCKMRILAAMQYAKYVAFISIVPKAERVYYHAWEQVVQKYTKKASDKEPDYTAFIAANIKKDGKEETL